MAGETAVSPCPVCRKIFTDVNLLRRHARHCTSVSVLAIADGISAPAPETNTEPCQKASRMPPEPSYVLPDEASHLPLVTPRKMTPTGSPVASPAALTPTAVKTSGPSAVMGEVCWFCRTAVGPADSRTSAEYGGMPILFHKTCLAGVTAVTEGDAAVVRAYCKLRSAVLSPLMPAAMLSAVKMSSMRIWFLSWEGPQRAHLLHKDSPTDLRNIVPAQRTVLQQHDSARFEEHHHLNALAATSTSHKRALQGLSASCTPCSVAHDIDPCEEVDEDDEIPFGHLAMKHRGSSHAVVTDTAHSSGKQDMPSMRPITTDSGLSTKPASDHALQLQEVTQAASNAPQSMFYGRDGYKWQYCGAVPDDQLPPLLPDELRVLSHHLSPKVSRLYKQAQRGAPWSVKVLGKHATIRDAAKKSAIAYLRSHMPAKGSKPQVSNLPEDPAPDPRLKVTPIEPGDYRKGLRAGIDLAVHTTEALEAGTVLGLYRNLTVLKGQAEEEKSKRGKPEDFPRSHFHWQRELDAYIADINFDLGSKNKFLYEDLIEKPGLACMAYTTGNIMAIINDGAADPMSDSDSPDNQIENRPENTRLLPIAVGRWPFLFVVTIQRIEAGEELLLDYSEGFWHIQQQAIVAIEEYEKAMRAMQQSSFHGAGSFSHTPDQGSGAGLSHLQAAYSEPVAAVSALSAATPAASSAKPSGAASLQHAATAPVKAVPAVDSPQDHLEEAAAESQPCPEDHVDPVPSALVVPQETEGHDATDIRLHQPEGVPEQPPAVLPTSPFASAAKTGSAARGLKRQRSEEQVVQLSGAVRGGLQPLPLLPGIEAAIRRNPGLVKGYADSKLAQEQLMQKLMPDLLRLEPLCAKIIADSRGKFQKQKQHQHASAPEQATDPVEPLTVIPGGNKKARLDSEPTSSDPVAAAAAKPGKRSPVDSRQELHRMDSRTGSSGMPAAGQPFASTHVQQPFHAQTCEQTANEQEQVRSGPEAQLTSHKQLDKLTSLDSTSSPLLLSHPPLALKQSLQKQGSIASAQRKPSVPAWQDVPAKKLPAVATHSGQEDTQHQHSPLSSRLTEHSSPSAIQSAAMSHDRREPQLTALNRRSFEERHAASATGLKPSKPKAILGFGRAPPKESLQWKRENSARRMGR